jgi:hypothetical protein
MPDGPDFKKMLTDILDTQLRTETLLIDLQIQIVALTKTLVALDSRAAIILSDQVEALTAQYREKLEDAAKDLALTRATVSSMVQ